MIFIVTELEFCTLSNGVINFKVGVGAYFVVNFSNKNQCKTRRWYFEFSVRNTNLTLKLMEFWFRSYKYHSLISLINGF